MSAIDTDSSLHFQFGHLPLLLSIMILVLSRFTFRSTFSQNDSNLLRNLCKPFVYLTKTTKSSSYSKQFVGRSLSMTSVVEAMFSISGKSFR